MILEEMVNIQKSQLAKNDPMSLGQTSCQTDNCSYPFI